MHRRNAKFFIVIGSTTATSDLQNKGHLVLYGMTYSIFKERSVNVLIPFVDYTQLHIAERIVDPVAALSTIS